MFSKDDGIPDNLDDSVGRLARTIKSNAGWNAEVNQLRGTLVDQLESKGYIEFAANVTNYGHWHVGESMLFFVPTNRRGPLRVFVGKTIRLVCTRSGRYTRGLMAGVVRVPKDVRTQLQQKLEQNQSEMTANMEAKKPYLQRYLRRMGIRGDHRPDGLIFLAARENSSMVSTWTDILALENVEPGRWRLHQGGLEVLGSIHAMPEGVLQFDDDENPIEPTAYDGKQVVGLADGEFMLSDTFIAEESSEPFASGDYLTCRTFLQEQGWIESGKVSLNIIQEMLEAMKAS